MMKNLKRYIREAFRLRDDTKVIEPTTKKEDVTPEIANALNIDDLEKHHEKVKQYYDRNFEHSKRKILFKKNGEPPLYIKWWIALCLFGPMKRKELLRMFGLAETSYGTSFNDYINVKHIFRMGDTREDRYLMYPEPMSNWTGYFD